MLDSLLLSLDCVDEKPGWTQAPEPKPDETWIWFFDLSEVVLLS